MSRFLRRRLTDAERAWRPGPCDFCGQPSAVGDVLCDSCRQDYDATTLHRAERASHAEKGRS